MKKLMIFAAVAVLSVITLGAESIFDTEGKYDYTVTSSTSLSASVTIVNGQLMGVEKGEVTGKVSINTKTCIIRMGGKRVKYNPGELKTDTVENTNMISGKGMVNDLGGNAIFSIIEDTAEKTINMIVEWPDHSMVRFLAKADF